MSRKTTMGQSLDPLAYTAEPKNAMDVLYGLLKAAIGAGPGQWRRGLPANRIVRGGSAVATIHSIGGDGE